MYVVTGASLLVPLAGLITAPILAQALGVVGRGEFAAAIAPNSLVVSVATLGLPDALTFELARRPWLTRRALLLTGLISSVIGVLCLAIAIASASLLTASDPDLADLLVIGVALAIPVLTVNLLRGAAAGRQLWKAVAVERALNAALRIVLLAGFALSGQLSVLNAVLIVSIAPVVSAIAHWQLFRPVAGGDAKAHVSPLARPLLAYGSQIWLGAVAGMLYGRLSQLVITPLSDIEQLGLFVVAITISDVPLILAMAVGDVVFGTSSREANIDKLTTASRVMTLLGVGGAVALGVTLPLWISQVFGDGFVAATIPTWILLAASVVGVPGLITGAGLGAWGRPALRSAIAIVGLTVNVLALFLLVPGFGAVGAAAAGVLSALASSTFGVLSMSRTAQVPARSFVLPRRRDLLLLRGELASVANRLRRN